MTGIGNDITYGLRSLMRSPGFAIPAILVLGLGIGASTAAFTVGNGLFLRPLPVEAPARLVRIYTHHGSGSPYFTISYPDYTDIEALQDVFSGVLVDKPIALSLSAGGRNERIWGYAVSGNYFTVLGVLPKLGRLFSSQETSAPGRDPVVVLSHGLWQRAFGGRPEILGESIALNGRPFTVIGIAPQGFHGTNLGLRPELWAPVTMEEQLTPGLRTLDSRGSRGYFSMARLASGAGVEAARARLDILARQLQRAHPETNRGLTFTVIPEGAGRLHPMVRGAVLGFSGIVDMVVVLMLLLACANVAGLQLTRLASRRKEIGIRLALGASRYRIIRQLLLECLLLSAVGGAVGLVVVFAVPDVVSSLELPTDRPLFFDLHVDARVLLFCSSLAILTGVLFGLAPALTASRPDLIGVLKGSTSPGGFRRSRSRAVLVAGQVTLSTVLLIGTGLFLRSLQNAHRVDMGFDPDGIAMMSIDLQLAGYDRDRGGSFWSRLLDRVSALPGIESTGLATAVPLDLNIVRTSVIPEGFEPPPDAGPPFIDFAAVDGGYFWTLRIPLLAGRFFQDPDKDASNPVAVVNDTLARQFWPDESALGKRLIFEKGVTREVIGVVKGGKYLTLGEDPRPYLYLPITRSNGAATLVIRASGDPSRALAIAHREAEALDRTVPAYDAKTMKEHLGIALLPARAGAIVLGAFGTLALLLAALGLYGTLAYTVAQRTSEIGIRRALGARDAEIVALVVRQAIPVVAAGLATGVAVALATSRVMRGLLYGVSAHDPLAVVAAVAVFGAAAVTACVIPARRAARIEPMEALRCE